MIGATFRVCQIAQNVPDLLFRFAFPDAERRNFRARFDDPRRGNAVEKFVNLDGIKRTDKFGTRNTDFNGEISHPQFIAETQSETV